MKLKNDSIQSLSQHDFEDFEKSINELSNQSPRTGDVILSSSNTATAQMIRILSSSLYNHVGVAILFDDDGNITLGDEGQLYILEINTWERIDAVTGQKSIGAAYSAYDWYKKRYNVVTVRRLAERYRVPKLINHIEDFVNKYRGYKFTQNAADFMSMLIGVPLDGLIKKRREMLCSEFTAYFYIECVGPLLQEVDKVTFHGNLNELLGDKGPYYPALTLPEHYTKKSTPDACIFENDGEELIYHIYCDAGVVLVPIIIIALFLIALLWIIMQERDLLQNSPSHKKSCFQKVKNNIEENYKLRMI